MVLGNESEGPGLEGSCTGYKRCGQSIIQVEVKYFISVLRVIRHS